jgi:hypothetical protein
MLRPSVERVARAARKRLAHVRKPEFVGQLRADHGSLMPVSRAKWKGPLPLMRTLTKARPPNSSMGMTVFGTRRSSRAEGRETWGTTC